MTALTHRREPSARAWHEFSQRAQSVLPAESDEATRIVSKERIPFSVALERVQARRYAMEQGPQSNEEATEAFRFKYL